MKWTDTCVLVGGPKHGETIEMQWGDKRNMRRTAEPEPPRMPRIATYMRNEHYPRIFYYVDPLAP
jgi:hypothetical protein